MPTLEEYGFMNQMDKFRTLKLLGSFESTQESWKLRHLQIYELKTRWLGFGPEENSWQSVILMAEKLLVMIIDLEGSAPPKKSVRS